MRAVAALSVLIGLLPIVWAASCAQPSPPVPRAANAPSAATEEAGPPAVWDYHPPQPKRLRSRLDLGPGVRLFVGDAGERWLVDARQGVAEAAPMLADDDLVAVAQPSPGSFAFVGASGAIFHSATPLGALTALPHTGPPIWGTVAAGKLIVGMRHDGTPMRSTDGGRSFEPVAGVADRILEVAVAPDGRAMMLASPEALWISRDGGAAFTRAATAPVGANALMLEASGALVARGVDKSVIWEAAGEPTARKVTYAIEPPALDLLTDVEPGPRAGAIAVGRAALLGPRYFEAIEPADKKDPWMLASGSLAGRTLRTPILGSDDCQQVQLSGTGKTVVLGCSSRSSRNESVLFSPLRMIVSRDAGSTFEVVSTGLVADEDDTRVVVTATGTFLVTGACKPTDRGRCVPGAPLRLVPSAHTKKLRFSLTEESKLPPIVGRTGHVRASPDGTLLYATAFLLPERKTSVLISDDDGQTFRAVPVDLPAPDADAGPAAAAVFALGSDALTVDGTGKLSLVAQTSSGPLWVVLDRQARTLSARIVPTEYAQLAAVGARGLAVSATTGEVFESTDGGASFRRVGRIPKSDSSVSSASAIECVDAGCLIGDSFSRVGWGPGDGGSMQSSAPQAPASAALLTPIVCDVAGDVGGDEPGAAPDIDAFDADRGDVAWSAQVVDRATGAVRVLHGRDGARQTVESVVLLPPSAGDRVAIATRSQSEGVAALRYRFERAPNGSVKAAAPMRQVEIAWDYQLRGRVLRATIPDAGPLRADDVTEARKGEAASASIGMLSVADDGIFVCPHSTCDANGREVLFADERGRVRRVQLPELPLRGFGDRPLGWKQHVFRGKGQDVFLGVFADSSGLMRVRPADKGPASIEALSLLPASALAYGFRGTLTWAYQGSSLSGLLFTATHASHPHGFSTLLRFDVPTGAASAEPGPTQSALGEPPRACTSESKKDALRALIPAQGGRRHPVIIRDRDGAVHVLLTDYAVTYSSQGSTCASTFDTVPASGTTTQASALILPGAMDRSWLFLPSSAGGMKWRAMRCRYEPGATIPTPRPAPPSSAAPSASAPRTSASAPRTSVSGVLTSIPPAPPGIPSAVWTALINMGAGSALPPGFPPLPWPPTSASASAPRLRIPPPGGPSARPPATARPASSGSGRMRMPPRP